MLAAIALLFVSRKDLYEHIRNAIEMNLREAGDVILPAPTLAMAQGTRANRASKTHLQIAKGSRHAPPHSSSN
jgi:hypothetical protein